MKIIHRSILGELFYSFLIAIVALNFVLMADKVLSLTRVLAAVGASFSDISYIVLYLQPQMTVLTIPMAFLLATLLTYGRLNADSELVVMRSSGMSFMEASRPVFYLGTGCFVAGLLLSLLAAPASSRALRAHLSGIISQRAPYAIEEGIFSKAFRDIVIFVQDKPDEETFRGVFLYDERNPERPTAVYAREGRISGAEGDNISLELSDGNVHIVRGDAATEVSFGRYRLLIPVALSPPTKKYNEMSPGELLRAARTGPPRERKRMILEFHRRLSLPAICVVLMFFGPPLSLRAGKTGRLGGLSLGLLVFAGYYAALMYGENLVRADKVPHVVGAWAPAVLLGVLAAYAFKRAEASR